MSMIQALLMQGGARVDVVGGSVESITISPTDSTATYQLTSAGAEQSNNGSGLTTFNTWLLSGAGANYDVMATATSGTVTTGTVGSWLNLGTTRSWTKTRTNNLAGTETVVLSIQIRDASTLTVLDTASMTISATVDV